MKFLFKQRFFSWFDSYDIYDEAGRVACKVKGELAWGHMFRIYDANGRELGAVKQEIFSFMPRFNIYMGSECVGSICREFALFTPKYNIDFKNWRVECDWFEWDYSIFDGSGREVASITKELWNWTDTYSVDVRNPEDALCALMLVLAIDAEKCSRDD